MAHDGNGLACVRRRTSATLLVIILLGFSAAAGCEKQAQDSTKENVSGTASPPARSADTENGLPELPAWARKVIQDVQGVETQIRNEINILDSKIEQATSDPEDYYRRGKLRYRLRQYVGFRQKLELDRKALQDFETAHDLAEAGGHPLALLAAARVHLGRFEFPAGEAYVRRAEALAPDNIFVRSALALLNGMRTDEWDKPIAALQALTERPNSKDSPRLWSSLGYAYYRAGRYGDAERAYRRRVELRPDIRFLGNLGLIYIELGQPNLGQRLMETVLISNPSDVYAGINLAAALNSRFDPEKSREAIRVLSAVLDLAPTIPAAWNNLGVAHNIVGNYGEAVDAYQRAVELVPNFADAYYNMGIINDEWGRYDRAIGAYKEALKCSPDSAKILYNLGLANVRAQQFQEAESIFRRLSDMTPGDQRVWNNLGGILSDRRKYEEARPAFERALAIDARLFRPRNGLGVVELKAGNFDGAAECFQRVVAEHSDDPMAVSGVVDALLKGTDLKYALQVADVLVERLPNSSGPRIIRARIQLHANRSDVAVADCTRVIQINDRLAEPYTIRGIAHLLERNYTAAVKDFKQVLTLEPGAAYSALWSWSAWMALGEADAAQRELAAAAENVRRDSWEGNLLRFLQGEGSPDGLLELAQNDERRCEAYYYIGERMLSDGKADEANDWFKKCLETEIVHFVEPLLARRRLNSD